MSLSASALIIFLSLFFAIVVISIESDACLNAISTKYYGSDEGNIRERFINQGKIYGINQWSTHFLHVFEWSTNESSTMETIEDTEEDTTNDNMCEPFVIDSDDFIVGYRILFDDDYIRGLSFYTLHNESYECLPKNNISQYTDSGKIILSKYHLTGFYIHRNDNAIRSLAFEFSAFSPIYSSNMCNEKYIFVDIMKSNEDANEYCSNQYNSSLATVLTKSDFQIVQNIQEKVSENMWIGLVYDKNTNWKWIDSNFSIGTQSIAFWDLNEPKKSDGCVALKDEYNAYFAQFNCDNTMIFLCNNPKYDAIAIDNNGEEDDIEVDIGDGNKNKENEISLTLNAVMTTMIAMSMCVSMSCCIIIIGYCFCNNKKSEKNVKKENRTSISLRDRTMHPIEAKTLRFEGEERHKLSMDSLEKKMLNEMLGDKVENICINGGMEMLNRQSLHEVSVSILSDAMYEKIKENADDMAHTLETDGGEDKHPLNI